MSDAAERLRHLREDLHACGMSGDLEFITDAADEIDRLQAEVRRLEHFIAAVARSMESAMHAMWNVQCRQMH